MNIWTYLLIALLTIFIDALLCFAMKKRFTFPASLVMGLFWPITIPVVILGAWYLTRKYPPAG